jgi:high-affinity iron transporter
MVGRVLHALVGYTDRPPGLQVIVYLGTILVMIALMQWSSADKRRRTLRTA